MWAKFGQMAGKAISKIKKPKGLKAKAMGMVQGAKSKVKGYGAKAKTMVGKAKSYVSKNNKPLAAGLVVAGTSIGGYQYGKIKERKKATKAIMASAVSDAASDLGIRSYRNLTNEQKIKIVNKVKENNLKRKKKFESFYGS